MKVSEELNKAADRELHKSRVAWHCYIICLIMAFITACAFVWVVFRAGDNI